jgi:alpha-mannosidase
MGTEPIHMIGQAHLDVAWLWRWQEGYMEVLSTFKSALERIEETDDFIFTCSSAVYYQFVEENDPVMFEKICAAVKAGRWVIVGGWWIQPDTHLPTGESFARHALYSQRYYKKKFGITCKTGYCVDSFGQSAMLPQLLKLGGMNNYVFMRPCTAENPDIPTLFNWRSADGSEVLAYRITDQHYGNEYLEDQGGAFQSIKTLMEKIGIPVMFFYGVGNHGGGPTRRHINEIKEYQAQGEAVEFSSPDAYFDRVRALNLELPVWEGEMMMHAVGCYAVGTRIKSALRKSEMAVIQAEKADTVCGLILDKPHSNAQIAQAWQDLLLNDFHDIVCGCTIKTAYQDAMEMFGHSKTISDRLKNKAYARISRNINTMIDGYTNEGKTDWQFWEEDDHGVPAVFFNSHPWEVTTPFSLAKKVATVVDAKGNVVPIQFTKGEEINGLNRESTVFMVTVPPLGYSTYWIYRNKNLNFICEEQAAGEGYVLENSKLKVCFDKNSGYISSMYDKTCEREILCANSFIPEVYNDVNYDTWAHSVDSFNDMIAKMRANKIELIEQGSVRSAMRVEFSYQRSKVLAEYRLYAGSGNLEIQLKTFWQEKHTILKFSVSCDLNNPVVRSQIPYGVAERRADGVEYPMQTWVDIQDDHNGVAFLNDSKYSYDVQKNIMRITAIRNSIYADHGGVRKDNEIYDFIEDGIDEFNFIISPHMAEKSCAKIHKLSAQLNAPPEIVIDSYHSGTLPREGCFIKSPETVDIIAFKEQEDGNGYILRCYETGNVGCDAHIDVSILGVTIEASFKPSEIKTFQIADNKIREVDFCEWETENN